MTSKSRKTVTAEPRFCQVDMLGGWPPCDAVATGTPVIVWTGPKVTDEIKVELCGPCRKVFDAGTRPYRGAA